jgi:hypothetical protein
MAISTAILALEPAWWGRGPLFGRVQAMTVSEFHAAAFIEYVVETFPAARTVIRHTML